MMTMPHLVLPRSRLDRRSVPIQLCSIFALEVAVDADAVAVVARDDVARGRSRAADDGAARADVDAVGGVAEIGGAGGVGADLVALDRHRAGAGGQGDALVVGGDDVAGAGAAPPMVLGPELETDTPAPPLPSLPLPAALTPM